MSKLLGIDYGEKRVGIALSDDGGSVGFPRQTLTNDNTLIPMLQALIRTENVCAVVFGESRNKDGEPNPIFEKTKRFAVALQNAMPIAVNFEPEFYTSVEARKTTGKSVVDAEAAAIILNSYIARKRATC